MFEFFANVLAFFFEVWPGPGSFGGAIALFTLAIMLVLTPLSIKTARSMIAMQRLQPELKKLQAKHKGDREALNREMMAFYQEHNVNPFSSCLPLLLQMPVFFVLYQVLLGLTKRAENGNFDPKYLEDDAPLSIALRATDEMNSFGMDLSQSAWEEVNGGDLLVALPFVALVAFVAFSAYVQQRQVAGRNPNAANPQQQMIAKVMPFIFIPISVSIPAGVVVYFAVSNLVRIGQQAFVTHAEFPEQGPAAWFGLGTEKSPPGTRAIETTSRAKSTEPRKDQREKRDAPTTSGSGRPSSDRGDGSRTTARTTAPGTGASRSRSKKKKKRK